MIRGIYDAALGMTARIAAQDAIANNLANAGTNGFQREVTAMRLRFVPGHGFGLNSTESHEILEAAGATDTRAGALAQTGSLMDIALDGPGYLVVNTPQGERLFRGGSLHVSKQGELVNSSGDAVLSADAKPIMVGAGSWKVGQDGTVTVGRKTAGRIRVVVPEGGAKREGNSLIATGAVRDVAPGTVQVIQGYLEKSNVEPVREMVDMIAGMRAYEANQRSIVAQDQTLQSLFEILRR
jgi:flagellar basal-body rod protein FlgF